jgi:uncharacterized membrane protein
MKKIWSEFMAHFVRGLVFLTPIAVTVLLISFLLNWVRGKFPDALGPMWGAIIIVCIVLSIALIGFIGTRYIGKPISGFLDKTLDKIPVINTIYSSTKDMVNSFFGDNKKFDKPVLVKMSEEEGLEKIGFITQQNLQSLGLQDKVAVYFPISYSMAGDLYIVSTSRIKTIEASSSDVMRFLFSGGLTDPDKHHYADEAKKGAAG